MGKKGQERGGIMNSSLVQCSKTISTMDVMLEVIQQAENGE